MLAQKSLGAGAPESHAIEAVKLKRLLATLDAAQGNGTSVITLLLKP